MVAPVRGSAQAEGQGLAEHACTGASGAGLTAAGTVLIGVVDVK